MIYNSAGHHNNDPGAVATHNGVVYKENKMAIMFRDEIRKALKIKGVNCVIDSDYETLKQYLDRIKPGSGSVVVESHMNSFNDPKATGIEIVVSSNYSKYSYQLASMIAVGLHKITGLTLRNGGKGVITEAESKRGKLGLMRKEGIVVLIEYGFISNPNDVKVLIDNKEAIGCFVADCLVLADTWLT